MLSAISPLDGRYRGEVGELAEYFSEAALIRARLHIEVAYLIALSRESKVREVPPFDRGTTLALWKIVDGFTFKDAEHVKELEKTTRHDVKAAEYFLKERVARIPGCRRVVEFVHFGLTSEDVNNLAYGILLQEALREVLLPELTAVERDLGALAKKWKTVRMLALTHGQPATPTTVGKEFQVFAERLERQRKQFRAFRMQGKFGGAVGNCAAHAAAYPEVNWFRFGAAFTKSLGLLPLRATTQINPHDDIAELSHLIARVNAILLDCARDVWLYVSRGVFRQRVVATETGSSTMPHKVNPIDFENAEGNLGLSTALLGHFAEKLPVSRLQRDLSDSTVQRSIGVALGYHLLAIRMLRKGLRKIDIDREALARELAGHPEVVAEAVQTVLRKHGVEGAYERLKELTRGRRVTRESMRSFIASLAIPAPERERLLRLL